MEIVTSITQYMISPVISGYLVWWLTNYKKNKEERNNMLRQRNIIANSIELIIEKLRIINDLRKDNEELNSSINEMECGYYGDHIEELQTTNKPDCLNLYKESKDTNFQKMGHLKLEIINEFNRFRELPIDLLPPEIHIEINKTVTKFDPKRINNGEFEKLLQILMKLK